MKKRKKINIFVIWTAVMCLFVSIALIANILMINKKTDETVTATSIKGVIKNDKYTIPDNLTAYQKELYNSLSESLNGYSFKDVNGNRDLDKENEIVQLVVKNWIADFYTLNTKVSTYDVGGLQFIFSNTFHYYDKHARDTFYADLDGFIAQYGRENLPQVKSIESAALFANEFEWNSTEYPDYYVEASWTYEDLDSTNNDRWPHSSAFHVIYNTDADVWQIAQIWRLED